MLRRTGLVRALALAVVVLFGSAVPAPAATNLHNGLIVIRNHTGKRVTVVGLYNVEAFYVHPGERFQTTTCCFAAGTHYWIGYLFQGEQHYRHFDIVPKLCNNGFPFGYAEIEFKYVGEHGDIVVERTDGNACPAA